MPTRKGTQRRAPNWLNAAPHASVVTEDVKLEGTEIAKLLEEFHLIEE
ncbi:hypothetical protein [Devosia sp.]